MYQKACLNVILLLFHEENYDYLHFLPSMACGSFIMQLCGRVCAGFVFVITGFLQHWIIMMMMIFPDWDDDIVDTTMTAS